MTEFCHKAIYGVTKSGKTWLMKRLAAQLTRMRQQIIVWTPTLEEGWPSSAHVTEDIDQLEAWLNDPSKFGSHVFIDEAADLFVEASTKKHKMIWAVTRRGRHRGFTVYLGTQEPTLIPPRVRRQCAEIYCFLLVDYAQAERVWKDCDRASLNGTPLSEVIMNLPKLHCVHAIRPVTEPKIVRLD